MEQYEVKTITKGDVTVRLYRPILSESERAKRETHLKNVAEQVYKGYLIRKEKNKNDSNSNRTM